MEAEGLLSQEGAVLILIDIQEKLFPHILDREEVAENIRRLIRFARIMKMPILLTEQYPKGLGRTILEIQTLITDIQPIEKVEFSCFGSEEFREALKRLKAKTIIIAGIETHICVSQTALEGLRDYRVCVISDAVSSRRREDKIVALERMKQNGIIISSIEMLIYELLRKAGTPEFKEALKLIK